MALLFGVCFFLYLLELSAGSGFWDNTLSLFPSIHSFIRTLYNWFTQMRSIGSLGVQVQNNAT